MSYIVINDFKSGLDRRRLAQASEIGSLQQFKNAQINRGGEIEKTKAWVSKFVLPAKTFGLIASNGVPYVFGSIANPGMPSGVNYQQLSSPDATAMTGIVAVALFSSKIYVVAQFTDAQYHFYNGALVPDWYEGIVRASMVNNSGIAAALNARIVAQDKDVTATVSSAVITLTAKVTNLVFTLSATAVNDGAVDDQTITVATTTPASAGVAQVSTVTIGGTFDPGDKFTININNNVYGASGVAGKNVAAILTHKNKMFALSNHDLFFSCVANAALWRDNNQLGVVNTGSGDIDISAQSSSDEAGTALSTYQGNMAVYTRNTIQIWVMDADPSASVPLQLLENIGTRSSKTAIPFGDLDAFFLADTGERSLRSRFATSVASVTDVGTPIDDILVPAMGTLSDAIVSASCAAIEPTDGRYILSLDTKMYAFSYFMTSKISAWSTWEPGNGFSDFAVIGRKMYGRNGDTIYLLGGDANDQYTDQQVICEIPYIDTKTIATWKRWTGLDVILEGQWDIYVNTNPNQPDVWVKTATVFKHSVGQMKLAMQQRATSLKFKFVHQGAGPAKISKIVVHYEAAVEK